VTNQRIDLTLKLDKDAAELVKALTQALVSVARALDTGAADQALIAAKLKPTLDRLEKLNPTKE
jgi:hypothetical protein